MRIVKNYWGWGLRGIWLRCGWAWPIAVWGVQELANRIAEIEARLEAWRTAAEAQARLSLEMLDVLDNPEWEAENQHPFNALAHARRLDSEAE